MLKTIISSTLGQLDYTKGNKNKLDKNSGSSVGSSKIDNKNANQLRNTKIMSSKVGFFTLKACLNFTQLRKIFTKTPILYYFDLKYYIQIETNTSDYAIKCILSQLNSQVTYQTNN